MRASIIMPTYNKAPYLALTLASFTRQTWRDFELVLVDDGCTDATDECVRRWASALPIHHVRQRNQGRSAARNRALREAQGELLIFCDDDRLVPGDFVARHVSAAEARPDQVLIGWKKRLLTLWLREQLPLRQTDLQALGRRDGDLLQRLKRQDRCLLVTPDDILQRFDQVTEEFCLGDEDDNYADVVRSEPSLEQPFTMSWMCGTTANLSVLRRHVGASLRFDETYTGWGMEDTDFCYGLHGRGLSFAHCRQALNFHQIHPLGEGSLKDDGEKRFHQAMQNLNRFCDKHRNLESYLFWRTREGLPARQAAQILQGSAAGAATQALAHELHWAYGEILRLRGASPAGLSGHVLSGQSLVVDGLDDASLLEPATAPSTLREGPQTLWAEGCSRAAQPRVSAAFGQPPSTHKWWTPVVWQARQDTYCENLFPHPLCLRAEPDGLVIGYPDQVRFSDDGRMYEYPFVNDLRVTATAWTGPDVSLAAYGEWSAKLQWGEGNGREGSSALLTATAGRGLPYVYFRCVGLDEVVVRFCGPAEVTRNLGHALQLRVNGRCYGLFAAKGARWSCTGNQVGLETDLGAGCFSIAALPDATLATFELFARHAMVFVVDSRSEWHHDLRHSEVVTRLRFVTQTMEGAEDRLLFAVYPHQWKHGQSDWTGHRYASPRGEMRLAIGTEFTTRLPFRGVLPFMPETQGVDGETLYSHVDGVLMEADGSIWPQPLESEAQDDAYWSGKALLRLAELVRCAEACGHVSAAQRFLQEIRERLARYFDDAAAPGFYRDERWCTTLFSPAAAHGLCTANNDHAYSYGYFLRAVALVVERDVEWIQAPRRRRWVDALIRDVSNPERDDALFPFMRCFDVYAGHSWGSGSGAYAAGLNAEPSSEAIHYATSLVALGCALREPALTELGACLHAHETAAALHYWFDVDGGVFPAGFKHSSVGIVWGAGATHQAWWTADAAETLGVNLLPMQSGSLYLGQRSTALRALHEHVVAQGGGVPACWPDIHWMHLALHDAEAAWRAYEQHPDFVPEWGNSRAHAYRWIKTLAVLGQPDPDVGADTACFAVFKTPQDRVFVVYNETASARDVHFSNGVTMTVAPRAMQVLRVAHRVSQEEAG